MNKIFQLISLEHLNAHGINNRSEFVLQGQQNVTSGALTGKQASGSLTVIYYLRDHQNFFLINIRYACIMANFINSGGF